MKFILNKDRINIEDFDVINSGSIKYYKIDVEYDESWNDLNIEAILIKDKEEKGTAIALINNQVYIDRNLNGRYFIGFIGYTLENQEKKFQISTNLKLIHFDKGAGEIEASNAEDVPSPTEWEIYIAQIQEMINDLLTIPKGGNTGDVLVKKSNTDGDVEWKSVQDIHLINAYLDTESENAVLVLEMNSGTVFRINLGNLTPTSDVYFITKDDKTFLTNDDENLIVKEEE